MIKDKVYIFLKIDKKLLFYHFFHIFNLKLKKLFYKVNKYQIKNYSFIGSKELFFKKNMDLFNIKKEAINFILNRNFNIFGTQIKKFNFNWQKDYSTGVEWKNKFISNLKINKNSGNIKIPWELSRLHHLVILGIAYRKEKKKKYLVEFEYQLIDWIEKNPVYFSVNWKCTMEVAIRASNICLCYELFGDYLSNKVKNYLISSIEEHAIFITKNFEFGPIRSNHYISDIIGLLWTCIYFPEFSISEKWKNKALKELENEMTKQVYSNGVDFEGSTQYHRLVLEFFGYTYKLGIQNGLTFSKEYKSKLEKMFEFTLHLTKPNGNTPIIGDNDSGRFLMFENYSTYSKNTRNHLYILDLAKELFPKNKIFEKQYIPETKFYNEGGFYLLKNKDIYTIIKASELGQGGNGGHDHNDILSFEYSKKGVDFIIDPGNPCYTTDSKLRNHYRSTKSHNTISIDNKEQNDFIEGYLFTLKKDAKINVKSLQNNENNSIIDIEHSGYKNKAGITHNRVFNLDKVRSKLSITDILKGKGQHYIELNLQCDNGVNIDIQEGKIILEKDNIKTTLNYDKKWSVKKEDSQISYAFGNITKAEKIIFYGGFNIDSEIKFNLEIK